MTEVITVIERRGRRLAWREAGSAPTTAVLLHGLGGSRLAWEPQLAGLSDQFRVAAWDMPGYGRSAVADGPMTFHGLAASVIDLLDELEVERAHVVGLSFGSMIAQYAAAACPKRVASLVLLSTSPRFGLDGTSPEEWRASRMAPLDAGLEPIDIADGVLRAVAGPNISADALAEQRVAMAEVSGDGLRRAIDCIVTHDSRALLPSITAPTLCLVGSLDDETPPAYGAYVAAGIPGARLEVIDGAGHLLPAEVPDLVNRLISAHIEASR